MLKACSENFKAADYVKFSIVSNISVQGSFECSDRSADYFFYLNVHHLRKAMLKALLSPFWLLEEIIIYKIKGV